MYEIPIEDLDNQSFSLIKNSGNPDNISVKIKISGGKKSLLSYWFHGSGMSSIMALTAVVLGDWEYSDSRLYNKLEKVTQTINSTLKTAETDDLKVVVLNLNILMKM